MDIQRERHPKLRKYSYESKALKVKSRIDFFLVAKNLTQFVKKSEIYPSIAPDHKAIYISLSLSSETPRGRGLWKFTALFNNMRTLKFKSQRPHAFFAAVNQMFGGSSQLPTTAERSEIKSNR